MAYITQDQLKAKVPGQYIVEALDDDGDGAQDAGAWERLMDDVGRQIHAILAESYAVPFAAPAPDAIVDAALVLAAELLYSRRGKTGDQNPWAKQAEALRKRLQSIADGKEDLPNLVRLAGEGGAAIVEDARTFEPSGRLMI